MAERKTLLGFLYAKGLVPQAEVAVTQSIAWLCSEATGTDPLQPLIEAAGLPCGDDLRWRAEVVAQDRTRTDLECYWGGSDAPRVVVEAKLGHDLTVRQVRTYIDDLAAKAGGHEGRSLMVVLVPEHRRTEAEYVIAQASRADNPALLTAVWSYDEVLDALAAALGVNPDLEQLRGLIEVSESLDIKPFTSAELDTRSPARAADLTRVLNLASSALVENGQRVLPYRTQDPDFEWMRYVEVNPDKTCIGVGVRRFAVGQPGGEPWAWVRVHRDTYNARGAARLIEKAYPGRATVLDDGTTWMPLTVPVGLGGAAVQQTLLAQLAEIALVLGPAAGHPR